MAVAAPAAAEPAKPTAAAAPAEAAQAKQGEAKKPTGDAAKPGEEAAKPGTEQGVPAEAPKPPASDPFAAAVREQKKLHRQRQEVERLKAEADVKLAEAQKFEQIRAKAKTDADAYLAAGGLTYDELTAARLGKDVKPDPVAEVTKILDEKMAAFAAEQDRKVAKATWERFAADTVAQVAAAADKYPLVNHFEGDASRVPMIIAEYFQETGEPCTWEQAAQYLEKKLEPRAKSSQFGKKLMAAAPAPEPAPAAAAKGPKTISTAAAPAAGSHQPKKTYDREAAQKRALAAFERKDA